MDLSTGTELVTTDNYVTKTWPMFWVSFWCDSPQKPRFIGYALELFCHLFVVDCASFWLCEPFLSLTFTDLTFLAAGSFLMGFATKVYFLFFACKECRENLPPKRSVKILQTQNRIPDTILHSGRSNRCPENVCLQHLALLGEIQKGKAGAHGHKTSHDSV